MLVGRGEDVWISVYLGKVEGKPKLSGRKIS